MEIQNLFSFVSTLSGVKRFSLLKLVHPENVLEHTGMVAIFAFTIAQHINGDDDIPEVSMCEVLTQAIIHDWDEAVTGDVVRPTKYFNTEMRNAMKKLEINGIAKIAAKLELPSLPVTHLTAKDGVEGYIVAFADVMAAVHRLWEEVLIYGNGHMVHCAPHMKAFLKKLNEERPVASGIFNTVIDAYADDMEKILNEVEAVKSNFVEMAAT